MTNRSDGLRPDRGPAYRLAPDTPAEIAADLARLCAPAGQDVQANGLPVTAEPVRKSATVADLAAPFADMASALDTQADVGIFRTVRNVAADAPQSIGRRLALFGAAAALLVPPLARPAAAQVQDADAALIALAAELDRTLDGAAFAFDPVADERDQDRRLGRANALQLDIAALPAVGLAGVLAKAKAYLDSNSYDTVNLAELADSLAEDAERVIGGLRA